MSYDSVHEVQASDATSATQAGRGGPGLLEVRDLRTSFPTPEGTVRAVDGVSFSIARGEVLGLVGESGCGKSVTALSVMRLVSQPPARLSGSLLLEDQELFGLSSQEMRRLRGNEMAMIFQDPVTALNPLLTIGRQIGEPLETHQGLSQSDARSRAIELLGLVGIPDAANRIDDYPHQFSGGMCQRVMIAIALSCDPKLLIADEPTTALDVTIQAQILDLIQRLRRETGMSIIIITHDLGVVAGMADRINVMYAGTIIETGVTDDIFASPKHPYTVGLLRSIPRLDQKRSARLVPIDGAPPDLAQLPDGCRFAPRCWLRQQLGNPERCTSEMPLLAPVSPGHRSACHFAEHVSPKPQVPGPVSAQ